MVGRRVSVWAVVLLLLMTTFTAGTTPAFGSEQRDPVERSEEVRSRRNIGAGSPTFRAACLSETRFRVTYARVRAWTVGSHIRNIQFKYRLVPADTEGQFQWPNKWSRNTVRRFVPARSNWSGALRSGSLPQTHGLRTRSGSSLDWDLEIKLKASRTSPRRAYRRKMRFTFPEPDCSGLSSPDGPFIPQS